MPAVVALAMSLLLPAGCGGDTSTEPSPDPPGSTDPDPGLVEIAVTTTGNRFDEDGYLVQLTGHDARRVAINGKTRYEDLPPGDYEVTFSDAALNCPVGPSSDRAVTVESGALTRLDFQVRCGPLAYVATSSETSVAVVATATHRTVARIEVGPVPTDVVVSPDSAYVYVVALFDQALKFVNVRSGKVEQSVSVGFQPTRGAIEPAGDLVYVTDSYDNTVKVVSTVQRSVVATIAVGDQPRGVAVSPDGRRVYVTNVRDGTVSVIDAETRNVIETVDVGWRPTDVVVSPNGQRVYVTHGGGYVFVLDADDHSMVGEVLMGGSSNGIALSRDGTRIYATTLHVDNANPQEAFVIDAETLLVEERIDAAATPYAVGIGPDDDWLYVTNFDVGTLKAIDAETHEVVATVGVGEAPERIGFVTY